MKTRTLRPIKPRASRTPKRLETDLKTLADSANEAAKREAAQWFYFVTIMLTLAAIVGSTTHRVLFLEDPVKVPLLSVELPLRGFYVAAPAIFVVLHFYLLAQVRLMAGKVRAFLDAAREEAGKDDAAFEKALKRIDGFSVAQLVVADRLGRAAPAVRAMAWVTLVVAPVLLLLFFQVRFLPFHSEWITAWHRVLVLVDLVLIWALWPSLESGPVTQAAVQFARLGGVGVVMFFSGLVATIPGERLDQEGGNLALRRVLFDGEVDSISQRPRSLFSRRLVLPDEDFVPEDELARQKVLRTRALRGRRLEQAVLRRADLRRVDLTDARLQGADLLGAQLQGATLVRAKLQGANLTAARLQGAILNGAQLQGSELDQTQMQGASLINAQLQGARGWNVYMQGAMLGQAELQGAELPRAQLQGAWFGAAQLDGAWLAGAQLQGAWLSYTASLEDGRITLHGPSAWRLHALEADLTHATINLVSSRDQSRCRVWHNSCDRNQTWQQWVDQWLSEVPPNARDVTRRSFERLLSAKDFEGSVVTRDLWWGAPSPDQAAATDFLGDLACSAANAPYVARGILMQIQDRLVTGPFRDVGEHRSRLSARMMSDSCQGAHGLRPDERALLHDMAARR